MNNKIYIAGISLACVSMAACSDFLEREPLNFGSETAYYKNENDLKMAVNEFYDNILPRNEYYYGGIFEKDNRSDNQIDTAPDNLFYEGEKRTVEQSASEWNFENLRGINYFINRVQEKLDGEGISGSEEYINHYWGEGYFFRAWEHYRLLRNFGDAPILTQLYSDDEAELSEAARRHPRNEVARFIIRDLEIADSLMLDVPPETGRLCKDAAKVMMARVALYEATWERYHAGTAFVPGNSKWVGRSMYPDFSFPAGSAQAEVNYFLDVAIKASDAVAANRSLDTGADPHKAYMSMFNNTGTFADGGEVILARYYMVGTLSHSVSNYLKRSGAGTGLTKSLVNSFLMTNGLPIYASGSGYGGDVQMRHQMLNRDKRLGVKVAGDFAAGDFDPITGSVFAADTLVYPHIREANNERCTTGYEMTKWISYEAGQDQQGQGSSANPIFRAAEAYLTYIEAYYERYGNLGGNCDTYWRAIRSRAGVDPDYNKTIAATDLSQEDDLATMSRGQCVDATLYNIRRERRCEFYAENMRLDDLKRWRALDHMRNYYVYGMNLWDEMSALWTDNNITLEEGTQVSARGISNYLSPLQITTSLVTFSTGYNFPKPHYLEPIPIAEFLLAADQNGSTLYQNPGWPTATDGTADYTYDCD